MQERGHQDRCPGTPQCNSVNQSNRVTYSQVVEGPHVPKLWDLCGLLFQGVTTDFPSCTVGPLSSPSLRKVRGANRQGRAAEGWPGPQPPLCCSPGGQGQHVMQESIAWSPRCDPGKAQVGLPPGSLPGNCAVCPFLEVIYVVTYGFCWNNTLRCITQKKIITANTQL